MTDTDESPAVARLRAALGAPEIDVVRRELILPHRAVPYPGVPDKALIILFAARSGSTYAGQLLANHPGFGRINEWLNPAWLRRTRERYALADDRAAAQHLLGEHAREAFGFKCTTIGLVSSALVGLLDALLDCATFIVLRRDPVAQAVSLYKARLSGRFNSAQAAIREIAPEDYDHAGIAACRTVIETVYANHAKALAALGARANAYWYEDILADPAAFQRKVYAELGLGYTDAIATGARIERISDAINEDWIARFRQGVAEGA